MVLMEIKGGIRGGSLRVGLEEVRREEGRRKKKRKRGKRKRKKKGKGKEKEKEKRKVEG